MEATVIHDGVSRDLYVIGADWRLAATKSDAGKFVRGQVLAVGVPDASGEVVSTLSKAFAKEHGGRRRSVMSGTAVVAAVERNAVVFHALGDGRTWAAAVKDGAPLPGCDQLVPTATAHDTLSEYLGFVPNGVIIGQSVDASRTVEEVLRLAGPKQRALATYRKPRNPYLPAIVAAGAVLLVGAAFVVLQQVQAAREAAEMARRAAMARLSESQRIDAMVERYAEDARKAVERARADLAVTRDAAAQLDAWMTVIAQQPLASNGFRLDKADCDATQCKLTWRALPRATLAGPAVSGAQVLQRDDTSLVTAHTVPAVTAQPRAREDRLDLASRFHRFGTPAGLSFHVAQPAAPIVVPAPPKPDLPEEAKKRLAALQPVTIGHRAEVALTTPLAFARESAALLGQAVTANALELGPLTAPSGGAAAPLLKLRGTHVRLP